MRPFFVIVAGENSVQCEVTEISVFTLTEL